ncbi:MAG: glycosyltransferase [Candidatus Pacebacteria bacterium]|nr:glycosyltransferase [Candidatus Paceibacterota bacterium]
MKKNDIWLVIPGYNESQYLDRVLQQVKKQTQNIIYVDDGSSDRSVKIAQKQLQHVLAHQVNLGKGAALKTGCEYAFKELNAQAVILMDSDDQHQAAELTLFFKEFAKGRQLIFGERAIDHRMPLIRVMGNRLVSVVILLLFGNYIPDIPCGFQAFSKQVYQQLAWEASGYEVELEIAAKTAKLKIPFVTVGIETIYHDLDRGMTLLDTIKIVAYLINLRFKI